MAEHLLLALFILNILLTLLDASLGYHVAPRLMTLLPPDEPEAQETAVRSSRRMLSLVVVLYSFFNCLAYYRGDLTLMVIVTVLILADLAGQLYLGRRSRRKAEEGE